MAGPSPRACSSAASPLTCWGGGFDCFAALETTALAADGRIRGHLVDLANDDQLSAVAGELAGELASLDVLVHSAGAIRYALAEDASLDDLDLQWRVNLRAPFVLTRALLPLLRSSGGQVVFVNSSAAHLTKPCTAAYAATKAGLKAFADSLRAEVDASGVRVISVYPARTATPMQEAVHTWESREYRPERLLQPDDVALAVMGALDAPRTAEITDVHVKPFQP